MVYNINNTSRNYCNVTRMKTVHVLFMCCILQTGADGQCNVENCASCKQGTNECIACDDGYFMKEGSCVGCRTNCYKCSSDDTCNQCYDGHVWRREYDDCPQCTRGMKCNPCATGRYHTFDSNGNTDCVKNGYCPQHCKHCHSNGTCTECEDTYLIHTNSNADTAHCASKCSSQGVCTDCQTGYYKLFNRLGKTYCYSCPTHCISCTSDERCTECEPRHTGDKCDQCEAGYFKTPIRDCLPCPINCNSCNGSTCTSCVSGYYKPEGQHQCKQCPARCSNCDSNGRCTECKSGHYGARCAVLCHEHCVDGECTIDGCTRGCKDGYYKDSDNVCRTCAQPCKTCTSTSTQCTQCHSGLYINENTCTVCPVRCAECRSESTCTKCIHGFYQSGGICVKCPTGCLSCTSSSQCISCSQGHYQTQQKCEPCPSTCTSCSAGEQMQTANACLLCKPGYYGASCKHTCSENCIRSVAGTGTNGICFKDNGTCSHGCTQGNWGPKCEQQCSSHCADNLRCSPTDGRCDRCTVDRYGDHCELECNTNCHNPLNSSRICTRYDGTCSHGCAQGHWGPKCDIRCGNHCAKKCSLTDGRCDRCLVDRYGHQCEHECSPSCQNPRNGFRICMRHDGACSHGCIQDHWGPICDNRCSSHCAETFKCSSTDGRCDRCTRERYGDHCQHECNSNCQNPRNSSRICGRDDGACLLGCVGETRVAECDEDGIAGSVGTDDENDESPNTVAIVVGVVGGLLVCVGVVVTVCIVNRRRRNRNKEDTPVPMAETDDVTAPGEHDVTSYMNVDHHGNSEHRPESGTSRGLYMDLTPVPQRDNHTYGTADAESGTSRNIYMGLAPASSREDHTYGTADTQPGTRDKVYVNMDPGPSGEDVQYESVDQRPDTGDNSYINMAVETKGEDEKYSNLRLN